MFFVPFRKLLSFDCQSSNCSEEKQSLSLSPSPLIQNDKLNDYRAALKGKGKKETSFEILLRFPPVVPEKMYYWEVSVH